MSGPAKRIPRCDKTQVWAAGYNVFAIPLAAGILALGNSPQLGSRGCWMGLSTMNRGGECEDAEDLRVMFLQQL